jgi:DNA invertase Pin-like site-specific DNA recombinase
MRALVYTRISDDDGQRMAGVGRQEHDCCEVAVAEGATSTTVYCDNSISATNGAVRHDYERMLRDIRAGKADGGLVVTWAQDRLCRRPEEFEQFLQLADRHGFRFLAPTDGIDIRPGDGLLYPRIRSAVAAEEVRKIKVRVSRALAQNRDQGRRHGKLPFGWRPDGQPDPERAALVVEATDRLLAGDSLHGIARDWTDRGVARLSFTHRKRNGVKLPAEEQTTVESEWTASKVRALVARPANAGLMTHNGKVLPTRGTWAPLVPEDRWRSVASLLESRATPASVRRHLLGGLIACGKCGGPVYGVVNRSEGYEYPLYRCGRASCQQQTRIEPVDDYVGEVMVNRLSAIKLADLVSVERKVAMQATEQLFSDLSLDPAQLARTLAGLQAELDTAQAQADRLSNGRTEALRGLTGKRAQAAWDGLTDDRKRSVISLLATLTLMPGDRRTPVEDRIDVDWHKL